MPLLTTARVVARPTPWAPPSVWKPFWQPNSAINKPNTAALIKPLLTSEMSRVLQVPCQ